MKQNSPKEYFQFFIKSIRINPILVASIISISAGFNAGCASGKSQTYEGDFIRPGRSLEQHRIGHHIEFLVEGEKEFDGGPSGMLGAALSITLDLEEIQRVCARELFEDSLVAKAESNGDYIVSSAIHDFGYYAVNTGWVDQSAEVDFDLHVKITDINDRILYDKTFEAREFRIDEAEFDSSDDFYRGVFALGDKQDRLATSAFFSTSVFIANAYREAFIATAKL